MIWSLLILSAAGLLIRFVGIGQPLVLFHPLRHYRSALIARACYYDANPAVPEAAREIARNNRAIQPVAEPPLMEWAACGEYLLEGRENVEFARALAAVCWGIGILPVFFLARRLFSESAAIVAAAFYLFMPYAILATRTFQPDPLMTMCALWAALALARHHERPTNWRIAAAGALIALATFVKPMSIFFTVPLVLGLSRGHGVRWLINRDVMLLLLIGLGPPALFYGSGALFGSLVRDQFHMRFVPHLLPTAFFWKGLVTQIGRVHGFSLFAGALLGTIVARGAGRRVLLSLWAGYAAFAVAFTYHMPTHDYYHLPFVPLTALGVAALFEWARARAAVGIDLAWTAYPLSIVIALWGGNAARPRLTMPDAEAIVAGYEHIGELTGHDNRVLFLDLEYGYPLMYHSEVSGDTWPNVDDLNAERIEGLPAVTAQERFERSYARWKPHYFVVTDLDSLAAEKDLQELLAEKTTLVESARRYRVYRFLDQ